MTRAQAIIASVAAVVGIAVGVAGTFIALRTLEHTEQRDKVRDYFSVSEQRIGNLEKMCEEMEGTSEEQGCRQELSQQRDKFEQETRAWQETQELATLAPSGALSADAPKLSADEIAQLRRLLAGSASVPPSLLTADDYLTRGNAYYEAGEYEAAVEAYNRALQLRPDFIEALNNRGVVLNGLGNFEDALKDFDRALRLKADDLVALNNRGIALSGMGRYQEALADFDRVLALQHGLLETLAVLCNRAGVYALMGQFGEALLDLETAISGYEKCGDMAKIDEDFEKLRNDPEYGPRFRKLVGEE
jgi:tetratricopeptide (TPR) repeat protein